LHTPDQYTFQLPILVEFGLGVSEKVGTYAKELGKKVLIVTDRGIVQAGILKKITDVLDVFGTDYDVFDEVSPNPTEMDVGEASKHIKDEGCDFIIALGGGSSIDVAKCSALLSTNPGKISDYVMLSFSDLGKIKKHPLKLLTIPTTAGTGSEVDYWAVLTTSRKMKDSIGQPPMYPGGPYLGATVALVDPLMTIPLPPRQTACTGIDALSHLVETYVAKGTNPIVEAWSVYAIDLIARNLRVAFADGSNLEAREKMMQASIMGGLNLNYANLGGIHSLGEGTGGLYGNIPHGVLMGIFFPHVIDYNRLANPQKYARIAAAMGEDVHGLSVMNAAKAAAHAVRRLLEDLDLPTRLKDVGVKRDDLPAIAERAVWDGATGGNPRAVTQADFVKIAEKAYE
jgi:alcohol dehydrogenase class IV